LLGDDEAVRIVVDVGEADPVGAGAENAQAPGTSGFENIGQEQIVTRAIATGTRGGISDISGGRKASARTLGAERQRRS
jgi:hypothetical protein